MFPFLQVHCGVSHRSSLFKPQLAWSCAWRKTDTFHLHEFGTLEEAIVALKVSSTIVPVEHSSLCKPPPTTSPLTSQALYCRTDWKGCGFFLLLIVCTCSLPPWVSPKEGQVRFSIKKPQVITREAANTLFASQTCAELPVFKYILVFQWLSSCWTPQGITACC